MGKAILLVLSLVVAAVAATAPSGESNEGKIWEITDYIKGTAPKVRDQINAETERLIVRRKALLGEIVKADQDVAVAKQGAVERLKTDPKSVELNAAVKKADADRARVRGEGTPQERLDTATQFIKAKQARDKYDEAFVSANPETAEKALAAKEALDSLQRTEASLAGAYQWRQSIIDAIRNTYELEWPLRIGQAGLLTDITPIEITKDGIVVTDFKALEPMHSKDAGEGFDVITSRVHRIKMIVGGLAVKGMRPAEAVAINRNVRVVARDYLEDGSLVISVRASPAEIDDLLKLVIPLREEINPREIAQLSQKHATPAKVSPRLWPNLPGIWAKIPGDRRPKERQPWTEPLLIKANEWLQTDVVGDKMEITATFRRANAPKDGVFTLEASVQVPLPGGNGMRQHPLLAKCPEAMAAKLRRIKPGQAIRVTGTIQSIRLTEGDITQVELIDAGF